MRIVMFYHSLVSDWNNGNAHFLRGIVTELQARGHTVTVYEPQDGWSLANLRQTMAAHPLRRPNLLRRLARRLGGWGRRDDGSRWQPDKEDPLTGFCHAYPSLSATFYDEATLDLDLALAGADLVIVHEWNSPRLVGRIGEHRQRDRRAWNRYRLLFHDTHHRSATAPEEMAAYHLDHYDGVLAFGRVVRDRYLDRRSDSPRARRAWIWHEAADIRVFRSLGGSPSNGHVGAQEGDLVWVGNWGDEERTAELNEFLIEPVRDLGLRARIHGVRYPAHALKTLAEAGIEYGGWLPNYAVPESFNKFGVTVHVPRRPYVKALPGIPTIRVFEALACGIPLVCSPWQDVEGLFEPGRDFLIAQNGEQMKDHLTRLLEDHRYAQSLVRHGLRTIYSRHTCAHRVDELHAICRQLGLYHDQPVRAPASPKEVLRYG